MKSIKVEEVGFDNVHVGTWLIDELDHSILGLVTVKGRTLLHKHNRIRVTWIQRTWGEPRPRYTSTWIYEHENKKLYRLFFPRR